jgi:hypothetical protein
MSAVKNPDDCHGFIRSRTIGGVRFSPADLMKKFANEHYTKNRYDPVFSYQRFVKPDGKIRPIYYAVKDVNIFIDEYFHLQRDDGLYECSFEENDNVKPILEYIYRDIPDVSKRGDAYKYHLKQFENICKQFYQFIRQSATIEDISYFVPNWVIMAYKIQNGVVIRGILDNHSYFRNMREQKEVVFDFIRKYQYQSVLRTQLYMGTPILFAYNFDPAWKINEEEKRWINISWNGEDYESLFVKKYGPRWENKDRKHVIHGQLIQYGVNHLNTMMRNMNIN